MGLPDRGAIAAFGPRGGTSWEDLGDSFTLQNHGTISVTTANPGFFAAYTVTRRNPFFINSGTAQPMISDFLDSTDIIQHCYGFQVTASVTQAAVANLTLTMSIFRTVGLLSGAGSSTATTIPTKQPLTQTIPTGTVITLTNNAGTVTTVTSNAAAPGGTSSIPIPSTNLSAFADANPITITVGGGPAWGWTAAGGGTPLFAQGSSVMAPAITTNTTLIVGPAGLSWGAPNTTSSLGAIPLQEGDTLMVNTITGSGTATVQVLNVQPLIS